MIDKIMELIEDKTYTFNLVINGTEHHFTKEGKREVHNFLNAFKKTIDLEQVYNMLVSESKEVEKTSEIEEENIIKSKKSKKNGDSL